MTILRNMKLSYFVDPISYHISTCHFSGSQLSISWPQTTAFKSPAIALSGVVDYEMHTKFRTQFDNASDQNIVHPAASARTEAAREHESHHPN
jgi:hypothetical protein